MLTIRCHVLEIQILDVTPNLRLTPDKDWMVPVSVFHNSKMLQDAVRQRQVSLIEHVSTRQRPQATAQAPTVNQTVETQPETQVDVVAAIHNLFMIAAKKIAEDPIANRVLAATLLRNLSGYVEQARTWPGAQPVQPSDSKGLRARQKGDRRP